MLAFMINRSALEQRGEQKVSSTDKTHKKKVKKKKKGIHQRPASTYAGDRRDHGHHDHT